MRLPARSPDLNAFAERFARRIKESCVNRIFSTNLRYGTPLLIARLIIIPKETTKVYRTKFSDQKLLSFRKPAPFIPVSRSAGYSAIITEIQLEFPSFELSDSTALEVRASARCRFVLYPDIDKRSI